MSVVVIAWTVSRRSSSVPDAGVLGWFRHAAGTGMIGKRLGNWVIASLIGQGAMGTVYRARHFEIEKPVALKTLNPELARNPLMDGRMKKEALASARVQHENIVEVL